MDCKSVYVLVDDKLLSLHFRSTCRPHYYYYIHVLTKIHAIITILQLLAIIWCSNFKFYFATVHIHQYLKKCQIPVCWKEFKKNKLISDQDSIAGHKIFKYKFCTGTPKKKQPVDQKPVSRDVVIGWFWSEGTKLVVFRSFVTMSPESHHNEKHTAHFQYLYLWFLFPTF